MDWTLHRDRPASDETPGPVTQVVAWEVSLHVCWILQRTQQQKVMVISPCQLKSCVGPAIPLYHNADCLGHGFHTCIACNKKRFALMDCHGDDWFLCQPGKNRRSREQQLSCLRSCRLRRKSSGSLQSISWTRLKMKVSQMLRSPGHSAASCLRFCLTNHSVQVSGVLCSIAFESTSCHDRAHTGS